MNQGFGWGGSFQAVPFGSVPLRSIPLKKRRSLFLVADALFSSDNLAESGPAAAYFSCLAKKS